MKIGNTDIVDCKIGSTQVNKVYLGSNLVWEKAQPLFLDLFPNAAAAFSYYKLRNDYTGNCIKIRRDGISPAELDIGFVDNYIDVGAIDTFCGSNNGFLVTDYDHSINGNNKTQSQGTKQPKIYDGATGMIMLNSKESKRYESAHVMNLNNSILVKSVFIVNNVFTKTVVNYIFGDEGVFSSGLIAQGSNTGIDGLSSFDGTEVRTLGNLENSSQTLNITTVTSSDFRLGINGDPLSSFATMGDIYAKNVGNRVASSDARFSLNGNMQFEAYYTTDQSTNVSAIQAFLNKHYNIYWDGSQSALLNDYPNASAAYSLRALNSAYTDAAIRVRRSSDNTEQDIKLLYDGSLDTSSLLSFVGAGDGFVSTWYDQSGSGNNAIQATATKQGKVVDLGNLIINPDNMLPSVEAMGNNKSMIITATPALNLFAVAKINALVNANYFSFSTSPFSGMYYGGTASGLNGIGIYSIGLTNSLTGEDLNTHLANYYHNGSNYLVSKDSDTNVDLGVFTKANVVQILGRDLAAPTSLNGLMQEMIIYSTGDDSNNEAIKSNINSHYNIYAEDILEFNPYNIWDSEHITIDGTTTTLHDFNTFGDKIDMQNPTASNQPTYNAISANFNGLPSFTFDGVSQYFKADIVDYRTTDTSGVVVNVFRRLSGVFLVDLTFSQSNTSLRYISTAINTNSYRTLLTLTDSRSFRGNTDIVTGSPSSVVAYADEGSSYAMNINGNSETITMISGLNDGEAWFNGNQFDNVSIGAIIRSTGLTYGNLEWCMSGYFPYTDESTILEIVNFLKNKYGVA